MRVEHLAASSAFERSSCTCSTADATHDELDDAVGGLLIEEDAEDLAKQRIDDAVETVAEMQLTASQPKVLHHGFGWCFSTGD
jgi:hypothetical protein